LYFQNGNHGISETIFQRHVFMRDGCRATQQSTMQCLLQNVLVSPGFSPIFAAQTNILSNHRVRCKDAKGLQFFVKTMVNFHNGRDALV